MATILVVEDRPVDRTFLATILRAHGHSVYEAVDGADALACLSSIRPHLVISDVLMPTLDGVEFVNRMRRQPHLRQTPVIFYTANYHAREARDLARQCGVADVLTRTSDAAVILERVRALLENDPASTAGRSTLQSDDRRPAPTPLETTAGDLERERARLAVLVELASDLSDEHNPRSLLVRVASAIRQVTFAQYAVLGVIANDPGVPPALIVTGLDDARISTIASPSLASPLLAEVVNERRVVRCGRLGPESARLGLPLGHPTVQSLMLVPIATAARVHGWVALVNKLGADQFLPTDEEVGLMLASHAATAYENALLFEESRAHAAALETEIQERRHTESVLRDTQDRVDYAMAASGVGVWEYDVARDLLTCSSSLATVLGRPDLQPPRNRAEFVALMHPEDREPVIEAARRAALTESDLFVEFRTVASDGSLRTLDMRGRMVFGSKGPVRMFGVVSDITQRRSLEDQLRQAQKMEAIGQLAGGIAHDFNNMLTAILGYAQFIAEAPNLPPELRADLELIAESGRRASALTRQLLTFSRKQVLQPIPLDLSALIRSTSPMLQRLIGEHIQLTTSLDDRLPATIADPHQIEQIVLNLAVNARDAMPGGGRLILETASVVLDEAAAAQHTQVTPGHYVMLAVSDTGTGMDAATKARIFDPFFTTKPVGHGTGLGLATVYGIVKQTGGSIWVYSEPGRGTTFKVYLPRAESAPAPDERWPQREPVRGGREVILVVEDEKAVRTLMCAVLKRAGYDILEADSPAEAERMFAARHGDIALLITDVVMPERSGPELFARLSVQNDQLKVLYASGYTDGSIAHNGRLDPGVALLQKPFSGEALTRRVRDILDA